MKDHPEGFAVLTHDAPVTTAGGGMSSLLNDMAERVGHVFSASSKEAGYDPRTAPIYAHALVGMVTFVGQWVDRRSQVARRGGRGTYRRARLDGAPAPPQEAPSAFTHEVKSVRAAQRTRAP